mgnify:FL=1
MSRFSVNRLCWIFFSSLLVLTMVAAGFLGGGTTRVNAQDEPPRGGSVEELGTMPMVSEEGISSKEASSPPIPAVDGVACTDDWSISVGEYDDWTTIGAGSTDDIDSYPISAWDESGREYIYRFSTSAASIITVVLTDMLVDLDIFVLDGGPSGACNSLNAIAAGDSVTSFYALSNHVYYLVVDGFQGAEGDYTISVYSNDNFYSPF